MNYLETTPWCAFCQHLAEQFHPVLPTKLSPRSGRGKSLRFGHFSSTMRHQFGIIVCGCPSPNEIWRLAMSVAHIKKLIQYFFPHKIEILIILISLVFYAGYYLSIPLLRKNLIDNGFLTLNFSYIIKFILLIFLLDIVNNIIEFIKEKARASISVKIEKKLYEQIFGALFDVKQIYFKKKNIAEIINDIQIDINNIVKICDNNVFFVSTQLLMFVGGGIGLFIINDQMALIVLCIIPIKYFIISKFSKRKKVYAENYLTSVNKFSHWMGDTINGIKEIKLHNLQTQKNREMDGYIKNMIFEKKRMTILDGLNVVSDSFLLNILEVSIYLAGGILIFKTQLSLGSLFAFVTYTYQVMDPISAVMNVKYIFQGIIPSSIRYHNLLVYCKKNKENIGNKTICEIQTIEFKDVNFTYDKKLLFDNLSFKIVKGDKIVIMGENGTGKSTIIRLLLGLETLNIGNIKINGIDLYDIDLNRYRKNIFCLAQDSYIFNTTLLKNIDLHDGKPINFDKLLYNFKYDDLIEKYKDKNVGINGELLSSGERQKLLFARALAYEKDLYIFDEATSNLDKVSQHILATLLKNELKNKTVIIIAHNDSVLQYMNKIIFLKRNGKFEYYETLYDFMKKN